MERNHKGKVEGRHDFGLKGPSGCLIVNKRESVGGMVPLIHEERPIFGSRKMRPIFSRSQLRGRQVDMVVVGRNNNGV